MTVLLVEDEAPLRTSMAIALRRAGLNCVEADSLSGAERALETGFFDLVISDLRLPDGDGVEVLRAVRNTGTGTPVVIVTAYGTVETAVAAMKVGAYDFIQKPFEPDRLILTARHALEHGRLRREINRLTSQRPSLVTNSPRMAEIAQRFEAASAARAVLIQGEVGTGKARVARAIHEQGGADRPFVVARLFGRPETDLVRELVGDARSGQRGLMVDADGGTLLLDELGDLPKPVQDALARYTESGTVTPAGASSGRPANVRLFASSSRDLQADATGRRLRPDLYYWLDAFHIEVPPLRERAEDLKDLAEQAAQRLSGEVRRPALEITSAALELLLRHDWPGNLRELENVIERAMLLSDGQRSSADAVRLSIGAPPAPTRFGRLSEVERDHILRVLASVGEDRAHAAEVLGISRSTLRRKLIEYGLWNAR